MEVKFIEVRMGGYQLGSETINPLLDVGWRIKEIVPLTSLCFVVVLTREVD